MKRTQKGILVFCTCLLLSSCVKMNIDFGEDGSGRDPNISYYDDYPVELATYKTDSFPTSGHQVVAAGYHSDPYFGTATAASYVAVNLPPSNPVWDQQVHFDSLVLILKPNGQYYGDTSALFTLKVHRLRENIENEEAHDPVYFNPRRFAIEPIPLGQATTQVRPLRGTEVTIKLSDNFGQELLDKFRNNATEITEPKDFTEYFKGLYIGVDSSLSQALYYFSAAPGTSVLRLYYTQYDAFAEEKYVDFTFNTLKHFNHLHFNHTGSALSVFPPFQEQLINTESTGQKAFLHSNAGTSVQISFPTLLDIKNLHPYVRVIKAELIIEPASAYHKYPYYLPPELHLYVTNEHNDLVNVLTDPSGRHPLTGNLIIDQLYGATTQYSYDITGYIHSLLEEGRFSKSALMLRPSSGFTDNGLQRLILDNSSKGKDVWLKLYLLGL